MTADTELGGGRALWQWVLGVSFVVFVFTLQTGYAITNASVAEDLGLTLAQVGFIRNTKGNIFECNKFSIVFPI